MDRDGWVGVVRLCMLGQVGNTVGQHCGAPLWGATVGRAGVLARGGRALAFRNRTFREALVLAWEFGTLA